MASDRFQFTYIAENDFDDAIVYISKELNSPTAAKKFYQKTAEVIERICDFPESYPIVENEYVKEVVRKAVIDNYVLYYRYEKELSLVTILRIVYGKRDNDNILKSI